MRKIFSLLFLLLATLFVASCSGDDNEKKDTVKEITMYVSSETSIMFGLDTNNPEECMLVKIDDPNSEWQKLALNAIWWFSYERGHEYVLRVKMTILANRLTCGVESILIMSSNASILLQCGSIFLVTLLFLVDA